MIELDQMARGIANVLQGAGFDPHHIAECGRLLALEGQIRKQAAEEITRLVPRRQS